MSDEKAPSKGPEASLDMFVLEAKMLARDFAVHWRAQREAAVSPEDWPLSLPEDEWVRQFAAWMIKRAEEWEY